MRVLVTGGAGFLGSHVCDALVARGDQVVCVDNLSTGLAGNVEHLRSTPGFEFSVCDVCDGLEVEGHLDAVMHLASPASPADYMAMPLATMAAGSDGTRAALEIAHVHGAHFLLASTSEVYGDPAVHPQPESYWGNVNPIGPRSVYDEAKRYAEALTMAWRRSAGTNTTIVRIFNTYGPRLRPADGRVVSNFVVQAIEGRPLTVYGDGTQTRSLCFVDDMVEGLLALLSSDLAGPVNLGNPEETRIVDLARAVLDLSQSTSVIETLPLPDDDPVRRRPDISVARRELGWEPKVPLREGLQHCLEYFRELRDTSKGTTVR